jgi:hypothetical protein
MSTPLARRDGRRTRPAAALLPCASPAFPGSGALAVLAGALLTLLLVSLMPRAGAAHEAWLLTPEHMAELNAAPRPELLSRPTAASAAMLAAAALAVAGWLRLAARDTPARLRGILAKLELLERHAPLAVRACLALTLAVAALGLHPRHGTGPLEAATLGFPDLELRLLGAGWGWLAVPELALAGALLLGRRVRAAALGVLLLTLLGLALYGAAMLAYAGAMAGAAAYLLLHDGEGPGRERGLFLARILTGVTFLWCGLYYKVLQPNLALAIVVEGGVPTFGLPPEAFVLGMALVETAAGALMMAGVLVRPLALALFVPFLFLSTALGEDPLGHALFYGNLVALATGGAGGWRRAGRRDAPVQAEAWIGAR